MILFSIATKPSAGTLSKSRRTYILTNQKIEDPNVHMLTLFDEVDDPVFIYVTN